MRSDLGPLRLIWAIAALVGAAFAIIWRQPVSAADMVGMTALALWCLTETVMRRNWPALLAVPALMLGLGFALPLYLFLRSGRIV